MRKVFVSLPPARGGRKTNVSVRALTFRVGFGRRKGEADWLHASS